jgi:hypothetical protein
MMVHLDNPAGRLVATLRLASQHPHDAGALKSWTATLGAADNVDLIDKIASLVDLVKDAQAAIEATPEGEFRTFHLRAMQT